MYGGILLPYTYGVMMINLVDIKWQYIPFTKGSVSRGGSIFVLNNIAILLEMGAFNGLYAIGYKYDSNIIYTIAGSDYGDDHFTLSEIILIKLDKQTYPDLKFRWSATFTRDSLLKFIPKFDEWMLDVKALPLVSLKEDLFISQPSTNTHNLWISDKEDAVIHTINKSEKQIAAAGDLFMYRHDRLMSVATGLVLELDPSVGLDHNLWEETGNEL